MLKSPKLPQSQWKNSNKKYANDIFEKIGQNWTNFNKNDMKKHYIQNSIMHNNLS